MKRRSISPPADPDLLADWSRWGRLRRRIRRRLSIWQVRWLERTGIQRIGGHLINVVFLSYMALLLLALLGGALLGVYWIKSDLIRMDLIPGYHLFGK